MSTKLKLDDLNKGNIWTISESELNQMLQQGKKDESFADYETHYMNIINSVFDVVYFSRSDEERLAQLESQNYDIFSIPEEGDINAIAIRKRQINRINDLTLENISYMQPEAVLKLIEENMGTGWQGLSLAIQDIIESAFYVDCSVLPAAAMHRAGGIIDRRKADGYLALEVARGNWIEGIFIKPKPKIEKIHFSSPSMSDKAGRDMDEEDNDDEMDDDDMEEEDDNLNSRDDIDQDDDDEMDEKDPNFEDLENIDAADFEETEEEE